MILIDAEKIIWEINEIHKNHGLKDNEQMIFDETDVIGLIVTAPTIDAVPVVRCKDCKWWEDEICTNANGAYKNLIFNPNWYCASGERIDKG